VPLISASFETREGKPVQSGAVSITPISRALVVRFKGDRPVFVWNRPVAVRLQTAEGEPVTVPVHDETRRKQIQIVVNVLANLAQLAIIIGLVRWLRRRKIKSEASHE
jgi:hypothetical protein